MAMTVLQAINKMLRAIHEYPVAAVDTGGVTSAAQAEVILDEQDEAIQSEGWAVNREYDIDLTGADTTKVALVIADGAWDVSAMTLTKTAAFAAYTWAYGDELYVTDGTGVTAGWKRIASKTSDNVIVMDESIAAADAADIDTTLTGWEDGIAVTSDILSIDGYGSDDDMKIVNREGMLYDPDEDSFNFATAITVTRVRQLSFIYLPLYLQNYIVAKASIEFQRRMTQGTTEDAFLQQEYHDAKRKAHREDSETDDVNVLDDNHSQQILGRSRTPSLR